MKDNVSTINILFMIFNLYFFFAIVSVRKYYINDLFYAQRSIKIDFFLFFFNFVGRSFMELFFCGVANFIDQLKVSCGSEN